MRPNRKLPLLFALLLGCSLFGLSSCAQQAFYYPDHADYGTPAQAGLQHEDIFFQSEDGTRLHGWFIPAQNAGGLIPARATIIHFHGNAQNLSAHKEAVQWLPAHGYNVFLFDYRGYGLSEGRPNQAGLFADSNAALNYVRSRPDVDKNRLLVFGQSLGAAPMRLRQSAQATMPAYAPSPSNRPSHPTPILPTTNSAAAACWFATLTAPAASSAESARFPCC